MCLFLQLPIVSVDWCLGVGLGDRRYHVTLFSGPSFLQAPGEGFHLGGSCFPGLSWIPPSSLWLWHPANLLGTSSQAHLFAMSLNVAKYHLGKVKHELMQLASVPNQQLSVRQVNLSLYSQRFSPLGVRDVWGGLQGFCRGLWFIAQLL